MPDQGVNNLEILIAPLADMIKQISQGIAEAQSALDTSSIETQKTLKTTHPELYDIGYQVTWYQMPEITVELKVAVHYEKTGKEKEGRVGIFFSPFNAKYKNAFSYTAEGASTLKLRIVPVPPPVIETAH